MGCAPKGSKTVKDFSAKAREMSCAYHCNTCSQAFAESRAPGWAAKLPILLCTEIIRLLLPYTETGLLK